VPRGTEIHSRLRELIGQAVLADEVGLSSFGMSEQHFKFPTNSTSQPDLLVAAMARETQSIRLGVEVVVLPLHHPLHVAERIAMLDVISSGRIDFGVGRGNTAATADAFGVPIDDSENRALEALDIVLKAWQGEQFSYDGSYHAFKPVTLVPCPVQSPRPPIYWAAVSPGSHERGGVEGYNLLTGANAVDWGQLQRRIDKYRHGYSSRGEGSQGSVRVNVHGFCSSTTEKAHEIYRPFVVEYTNRTIRQYKAVVERSGRKVDFSASEAFIDNYPKVVADTAVVIGDPDTCISQLHRLAELGVDEVTFRLDGPSDRELRECITLLGKEVAPAVADLRSREYAGSGVRA
jgi:alkanesulfonate monooxygenase SsuD/methylene tetrahydromethanopterin reductase-like flavin-dependent oxidoreductase (luciferase family)